MHEISQDPLGIYAYTRIRPIHPGERAAGEIYLVSEKSKGITVEDEGSSLTL